jgi:hypothetical protein
MANNRVYDTGVDFLETITDFQNCETPRMLQSNCLSIKFVNNGNKVAQINGLKLGTNETLEIRQQSGMIDRTQYQLTFANAVGDPDVDVIRILPKNQSAKLPF